MSHFKVVALSTKSSVTDSDTVRTDTVQPTTANGNITIDVLDDLADSTLIITNSDAVYDARLQLNASTAVDTILDDDTMTADSATALATQQSIKAYVDTDNFWSRSTTFISPKTTGDSLKISSFEPKGVTDLYLFDANTTNGDCQIRLNADTAETDSCQILFRQNSTDLWEIGCRGQVTIGDWFRIYNVDMSRYALQINNADNSTTIDGNLFVEATASGNSTVAISRTAITDNAFLMFRDGPTNKWIIGISGTDTLEFRNLTPGPTAVFNIDSATSEVRFIEPIMIGSATETVPRGNCRFHGTAGNVDACTEWGISTDDYPSLQIKPTSHTETALLFNAYYDGTNDKASVGAGAGNVWEIKHNNANLEFNIDTTTTAGSAVTWGNVLTLVDNTGMLSLPTYTNTIASNNKNLEIDDSGNIGVLASLIKYKMNFSPVENADCLYDLKPTKYQRRLFDENHNLTNIPSDEISYYFLAEEVEQVNSELCSYNWYDTKQENSVTTKIRKPKKELAGLKQQAIMTLCVKAVQEQKLVIDRLEDKLEKFLDELKKQNLEIKSLKARLALLEN